MIRWLCRTLPPGWSIVAFVVLYGLFESLRLAEESVWGARPGVEGRELPGGAKLILFAAALYGGFRAVFFHPALRPGYRQWLQTAPWTWRDPLPLGPLYVVWQDLIIPGVLALLALGHRELHFMVPPLVGMASYAAAWAGLFWLTGQWQFGYAIVFGLALMVRVSHNHWHAAVVAAGLYVLSQWGIRTALRAFPWPGLDEVLNNFDPQKQQQRALGWPFAFLQAGPPQWLQPNRVSYVDGVLVSLLVGCWLHALAARIGNAFPHVVLLGLVASACGPGAAVIRTFGYCWGHLPPLSLWGRICTLRWIIPAYDRVFVAPLCTILAAAIGMTAAAALHEWWAIDPLYVLPATVTVSLLIAFNMGPSLERWTMTGGYRLIPAGFRLNPTVYKKL